MTQTDAHGPVRRTGRHSARTQALLPALERLGLIPEMPADHGHEYAAAIHPTHCMDFLGSAFRRWLDLPGHGPEVLSNTFPQLFGTGRRPPCPICYLDNAAIAAERLRSRFANVAILDIDDHHVDGIQSIFYDHTDVIGDCLEAFLSGLDS